MKHRLLFIIALVSVFMTAQRWEVMAENVGIDSVSVQTDRDTVLFAPAPPVRDSLPAGRMSDMEKLQFQLQQIQKQLEDIQTYQRRSNPEAAKLPVPDKKISPYFWGIRAGVFFDSMDNYIDGDVLKGGVTFSYTLIPSFGYYFNSRLAAGLKIKFSDCRFNPKQTGSEYLNFKYLLNNALLGNGGDTNYLSWQLRPYVRYRITRLFTDRLNLWVEGNLYVGQRFGRDNDRKINPNDVRVIFGADISAMLSFDITPSLMLCTSTDLIRWDSNLYYFSGDGSSTNSFAINVNPIYAILSGILRISIIKHF